MDYKSLIVERVSVTRDLIVAAKQMLARDVTSRGTTALRPLAERWIAEKGAALTEPVQLPYPHLAAPEEVDGVVQAVARRVSLEVAFWYAVWEMVPHTFIPTTYPHTDALGFGWATPGHRSGWRFDEFPVSRIETVVRRQDAGWLSDPDLYVDRLETVLHPGVAKAFRAAVRNYRAGEFDASVAMLGAGAEGLVAQLARALADSSRTSPAVQGVRDALERGGNIGPLLGALEEVFRQKHPELKQLRAAAKIGPADVLYALRWADDIRDSRNVLHWEVEPALTNDAEKVGLFLESGVRAVRIFTALQAASETA